MGNVRRQFGDELLIVGDFGIRRKIVAKSKNDKRDADHKKATFIQ
jgi:hypothetical protein